MSETVKANKITFSDEELKTLRHCIEWAWDTIAGDIDSMDEGNGLYSRYDVAEMALDADRWQSYTSDKEEMAVIVGKLVELSWRSPKWKAAIRKALPSKTYSSR